MNLEYRVYCLYQVHRPLQIPKFNGVDYGCYSCIYDTLNNKKCPDYKPYPCIVIEVKNGKNKKNQI